jgi:hypothetical protein
VCALDCFVPRNDAPTPLPVGEGRRKFPGRNLLNLPDSKDFFQEICSNHKKQEISSKKRFFSEKKAPFIWQIESFTIFAPLINKNNKSERQIIHLYKKIRNEKD